MERAKTHQEVDVRGDAAATANFIGAATFGDSPGQCSSAGCANQSGIRPRNWAHQCPFVELKSPKLEPKSRPGVAISEAHRIFFGVLEHMNSIVIAPTPSGDRITQEFAFEQADFERVRQLIYQRAGISLHSGKQAMVYSRLSRRLRETTHRSFGSYLKWLESASGPEAESEWQEFINCLTTNLTSFFREGHHFEMLAEELQHRANQPVRIWCNAASTGEEPYSIAMTVSETLGLHAQATIFCSDIDTKVLATARRGVYSVEARGLSPERLKRHFLRGKGSNDGHIRVKPELAKLVDFRVQNLMDAHWSLGDPFDIVFCRNVMIYFDAGTQRRVLQKIHGVMKPKGLLFVGHSENFTEARDLFRLRGKTVYERV
jgi:chemotaxis protein methyltransferase CheR